MTCRESKIRRDNIVETIDLLGFPLISSTLEDATTYISDASKSKGAPTQIVCHINANNFEHISGRDGLFKGLRQNATMFMDGVGVKLAAAYLGKGWRPDINGTDLFPQVMSRIKDSGMSVFLLGGTKNAVERAARNVQSRWPIPVAGCRDGYFAEADEPAICEMVNGSGAQILLVGLGCPLQEEFVLRNRFRLRVSLIWLVGGLFDFVAGIHPRAPLSVRKARLEWLFRWIVEPRAKAYRTWILYPRFVLRVARARLSESPRTAALSLTGASNSNQALALFPIISTKAPVTTVKNCFSTTAFARTVATELLARKYGAPPYLIIFVSDKCWMRCSHCWFSEDWKTAHHTRPFLSFDQYSRLADSARLHFVSFTGGEALRRDDIVELVTMMRRKSRITRYAIPTSGYLPDMIEDKTTQLLLRNPDTPFRLDVSLDGTAAIHDRIRRIDGGWARAVETIKRLNRLKIKYPHFDVGVITTVSRSNQDNVEEISQMIKSIHPGEWMINVARGQSRDPRAIDVDLANYQRAAALADMSIGIGSSHRHRGTLMGPLLSAKNSVRRRIIADTIQGRRHGGGCAAGSLGGVIYADGAVHACELLDDKLGNLHDFDYDLTAIWQADAARKLRRHIQESRCQCTQECFLSVSMLIQPTAVAGMAGEIMKRGARSVAGAFQESPS